MRREDEEVVSYPALGVDVITGGDSVRISDFYAYLPLHRYIFGPVGELWLAESVNARLPRMLDGGRDVSPAVWLDRHAAVEQMTWAPGEPQLILEQLIDHGGWIPKPGCRIFNLYRPPKVRPGNGAKARPWVDHLHLIYPSEAEHIERWLAHRVQRPGEKVNHAIVLAGAQGIGKDTLLEPVKHAIGPWNWAEINPAQMLMRFNGWTKSVVVRISEARDMGDYDRYKFNDHSKTYIAAPPDVLRVDEKNKPEYSIPNVLAVVITTNHESDGIYLTPDDRRHFVASSKLSKEDFTPEYWTRLWKWYEGDGYGDVASYLREIDLSGFDPKAPPPKTEAWWRIVHASAAPEGAALAELIEALGNPPVLTIGGLAESANLRQQHDLVDLLTEMKSKRVIQHRLEDAGYVAAVNQDRKDGRWRIAGKPETVFAMRSMSYTDVCVAVKELG